MPAIDGFPEPTTGEGILAAWGQAVNSDIQDLWDGVFSGTLPDASTSTKGVSRLSVAPASAGNPIAVGDNDSRLNGLPVADAATGTKGLVTLSTAPASPTAPIAVGDNDPRLPTTAQVGYIPTSDQKDAMDNTAGSATAANPFVLNDDGRLLTSDMLDALDRGVGEGTISAGDKIVNETMLATGLAGVSSLSSAQASVVPYDEIFDTADLIVAQRYRFEGYVGDWWTNGALGTSRRTANGLSPCPLCTYLTLGSFPYCGLLLTPNGLPYDVDLSNEEGHSNHPGSFATGTTDYKGVVRFLLPFPMNGTKNLDSYRITMPVGLLNPAGGSAFFDGIALVLGTVNASGTAGTPHATIFHTGAGWSMSGATVSRRVFHFSNTGLTHSIPNNEYLYMDIYMGIYSGSGANAAKCSMSQPVNGLHYSGDSGVPSVPRLRFDFDFS